jgi:hypothetical protein
MTLHVPNRILRKYRSMGPGKFYVFNQRVRKGLTDNPKIPASTWGANPGLVTSYLATSDKHDAVYHVAGFGSVLDIAERELLQAQLVNYLDEIAADLEAEAVRNPEMLLSSGFDLGKERRGISRKKSALAAAEGADVEHHDSTS